ncbi:CDP-glycerol glycerophosphotransferase family protein [Quadrisphaera sp. DSM 44207]|uniref:CDP-glycerol glycerophosphotransferase family protein n=1 Tax=Quadrisphaera sp. DSM 44207 TaxID=1881057 RepID=UPI00088C71DC|nr:CDP-glycerol glycerophosphotransferase family protein [Quadrisphaera sp. DSM 44207]SDQ67956.1 CDP-glycerol glycerophosphotransferase, TagB/SpsB family [Quadrisphaera sp. DSM 44207]
MSSPQAFPQEPSQASPQDRSDARGEDRGEDRAPRASAEPAAGRFPRTGGGGSPPSAASVPRRLVLRGLDLVNRVVPKTPGTMVLHSSVDVEDGVLAVLEEASARGQRVTVLLEDPRRAELVRRFASAPVRTLPRHSLRGRLAFLTAACVMTTGRLYGSRTPPPSQVVVALWHGEPPTKATGRFEGRGGLRCTYAPVCSTVGRAYRAAEFGISPLQVPVVGAPRNDRMLRADAAGARAALLGEDAHRTTFLWMPSYRVGRYGAQRRLDTAAGEQEGPFPDRDLRRLDAHLERVGARVVLKVHPRDAATFAGSYRAIRVLPPGELERHGLTVYTAAPAFDALITDMSSIWVDYLLLDKPIVYAFPDVGDYRAGRGLNLEPYEDWVPGPFTTDVDQLVAALQDVVDGRDPMAEERARARRRFHEHHDDRSAARLLDGLGIPAPPR